MEIDIDKSAKDVAKQMDNDQDGTQRDAIGGAIQNIFNEINNENRNNPNLARAIRRQFIGKINSQEKNGIGDDLTIKIDPNTGLPKHYTILPARDDRHAHSIAIRLDTNRQANAVNEMTDVSAEINKREPNVDKQNRDKQFVVLAIDAYENNDRDDAIITYNPLTGQPMGFDIDFTPKEPLLMPKSSNDRQILVETEQEEIVHLRAELPTAADQSNVRNKLMHRLVDCGRLLSSPPLELGIDGQRLQAKEGERMYAEALQLARHYAAPADMQANILNMMGFNQMNIASSYYDPLKPAAAQNQSDLATYRSEMAKAIETFKQADRLLKLEKPNEHVPLKISVLGNLALAEVGLANEVKFDRDKNDPDKKLVGDKYAVSADAHYYEATIVYGSYNPQEGAKDQKDVIARTAEVDKAFLDYVLKEDRYPKLLQAIGDIGSYIDAMKYNRSLKEKSSGKSPVDSTKA